MPASLNGFGTKYCGACDHRPDYSFVTTEWIVLLHIPVFPLRSLRLIGLPNGENWIVYSSQGYIRIESLPLHWRQVLGTYGRLALYLLWVFGLLSVVDAVGSRVNPLLVFPGLIILILLPLFIVPRILRRIALKKVQLSEIALIATLEKLGLVAGVEVPGSAMPPPLPGSGLQPPPLPDGNCE